MKKRVFSVVLSVALVLAMLPATAIISQADPPTQIKIQITNNNEANGSVSYQFNDASRTSRTVTASDKDAGGNITVIIPNGATTVKLNATPNSGFELQDFTILVNDNDIDEEKKFMDDVKGEGYTYALPKEGEVVFKAVFAENLEWSAISWGGGNVRVENGQVEAYAVHVGNITYSKNVNVAEGNLHPISEIMTNESLKTKNVTTSNLLGDLFVNKKNTEPISIDFRFIPDYGYQVTNVFTNENESLLDRFVPGGEISNFTFNYDYVSKSNVHFNVVFSNVEDIINIPEDSVVQEASIANGENAIDSGNLQMNIEDVLKENASEGLKNLVGNEYATYLGIELKQVVSKTGDYGNWEETLTDLGGEIAVSLNVKELDRSADYYVVREHYDEEAHENVYDTLPVDFNRDENTVTFDTNKFSTYALVKNTLGNNEFQVEFDDRFDGEEYGASVNVGKKALHNGNICEFTTNEKITFTLNPPEDREGYDPIVEIEVREEDVEVYRSDFEDGDAYKIEITENSFDFIPTSDAAFIVRIWWSKYDSFGPEDGQYMIETNVNGNGSIVLSPKSENSMKFGDGNPRKDCYKDDEIVTLSFVPNKNSELVMVAIGADVYKKEPEVDEDKNLDKLWNEEAGEYQVVVDEAGEGDCFYIEGVFADIEPEENPHTGDFNNIVLSTCIAGFALIAIIALAVFIRKKKTYR